MSNDKKTQLYQSHIDLKAKMVSFGGWSMLFSMRGGLLQRQNIAAQVSPYSIPAIWVSSDLRGGI